jgi:hypothetical protein
MTHPITNQGRAWRFYVPSPFFLLVESILCGFSRGRSGKVVDICREQNTHGRDAASGLSVFDRATETGFPFSGLLKKSVLRVY